ncbi:MAG: hypothetical protein WBF17_18600, partial [Phycisphaerae bacterium]
MSCAKRGPAALGVLSLAAALAAAPGGAPKLDLGPWHQIGPFSRKGADAFEYAFPPESKIDLAAACDGLRWRQQRPADDRLLELSCPGGAVVYLYRQITSPEAATISVRMVGDDAIAAWCNGRKVISNRDSLRGLAAETGKARLDLRKGENQLLVKVWNRRGKCRVYFSTSDKPASPAAGKRQRQKQPKAKAKPSSPPAPKGAAAAPPVPDGPSLASVRLAVEDMIATFGPSYPKGPEYLRRLTELDKAPAKDQFAALARRALLANPLLDFDRLLVIKRDFGDAARRVMS